MKKIDRSEILDLGAYEQIRPHFRNRVIELKRSRRLQLGEHMSFVFENHDTMLLQIQEMLRTERITKEQAIVHELETYNELVPDPGNLSATQFIEYDDPTERSDMLARFATLRDQVHLQLGERRVTAKFTIQFGEEMDRLPAVNYLTFEVGADGAALLRDADTPGALVVPPPDYSHEMALPPALRQELADDLS